MPDNHNKTITPITPLTKPVGVDYFTRRYGEIIAKKLDRELFEQAQEFVPEFTPWGKLDDGKQV